MHLLDASVEYHCNVFTSECCPFSLPYSTRTSTVQQNCTEKLVPSAVLQVLIKEIVIGIFYILFTPFGHFDWLQMCVAYKLKAFWKLGQKIERGVEYKVAWSLL